MTCAHCQQSFKITDSDQTFYQEVKVPKPTLCPKCREQRRLSFRNERNLHHRSCDLCQKSILSIYSSDKPYTVYCAKCWWSDEWDPLQYGRDFDFGKPFFEQFNELMQKVPQLALMNVKCENSDYTNQSYGNKNCYMTIASDLSEDCYYTDYCFSSSNCVDCLGLQECQQCYECIDCIKSYQCYYSQDLSNCSDCYFSSSLRNCRYCFGCTNLRNKEYYIFNQPVSKEEWHEKVGQLQLTQTIVDQMKGRAKQERLKQPHLYALMNNCTDCSGNHLNNSNKADDCYESIELSNSRYCTLISMQSNNCYDISGGAGEQLYEAFSTGGTGANCRFCGWCWKGICNLTYCFLCMNSSHDLFGCVGLKKKSYCILNKQYTKQEYEELIPRIIEHMKSTGEWGEFFPTTMSPFGYNETVAQEYFPITKEEANKLGYKWSNDQEVKKYKGPKYEIPDNIADISDELCKQVLICETSGKPYKVIPQELKYYRNHNLPIPRKSPQQRHLDRMALRTPRQLWDRGCAKCSKKIKTAYSPEQPETVYCESCYLKEVY